MIDSETLAQPVRQDSSERSGPRPESVRQSCADVLPCRPAAENLFLSDIPDFAPNTNRRLSLPTRGVSCFLRGIGLKFRRRTARANISGVTSGMSEKSISSSFMASSRFKSVFDFFVGVVLLISSLVHDSNRILSLTQSRLWLKFRESASSDFFAP